MDSGNKLQRELRLLLLDMYFRANAGHIGCSLSCIDILIAIYFRVKKKDDVVILSKGHAAASLYACLHTAGEITKEQLMTFYHDGTRLPAHPAPSSFSGIPFATGSLGHGFPIAAGAAKTAKLKKTKQHCYVVMSD